MISLIQIFLIINSIPSGSYIISQFDFSRQSLGINNNSETLIPELAGFLISLLSIKQIGIVSAQDLEFNCCVKTNNGAICQNVISGISSSEPESCSDPLPASCEETSVCRIGTCVQGEGLSCAANSPKQECENNNGVWESLEINEVAECKKGACVLGGNIQLTTEKQCELLSESRGLEIDFRPGLTELNFPEILGTLQKGACVFEQGNCRFVSINECNTMNGKFYENLLCSNPNLATSCQPSEETICLDDKVHFIDTCGNPANVYDSSKVDAESNPEYWEVVSEPSCNVDLDNPNSVKSCGNCNVLLSSQCSESSEGEVNYGNYVCKNLKCIDEKGNVRENGENWCIYDSYIGDGKDTVGSEHWLASCNFGELEVNLCGNTRGQICSQRIIKENGKEFSTAACVVNEAIRCLNYNKGDDMERDCNENSQCEIKNVDVDKNFKFSMCTPEYPRGLDLTEPSDISTQLCSIANQECTVVYQKKISGWKCIANCACETAKFAEEMNNLCISLGDCGSYINFVGDGTDNIQVQGAPGISWTKYKSYAKAVEGKYVELEKQGDFLASIGAENIDEFTPEEYNELVAQIGATGITFGAQFLGAYFATVPVLVDVNIITPSIAGLQSVQNFLSSINFAALGVSAVGGILGTLAGEFLVDAFGITGGAATVVVMAAGIAGSTGALALAAEQGFITLNPAAISVLYTAAVIALIIIAIIIILGIGKTKEVKVNFTCLPWQAPTGGNNCELCNNGPLKPCTKYRCESLGQACKLLNENTNNPTCQSIQYETIPPVISPGEVKTQGYKFQNQESKKVEIRKNNGECIQEFVPIEFTLETNENAQCKWSLEHKINYESMENYPKEGTYFSSEHTFIAEGLSLSILEANNVSGDLIEGFTGDVNIFVRCQDYFGNFNLNEYTVNFCVNSGLDSTPVLHSLTVTSPKNKATFKHGINEVNFTMWINEPAECKYDLVKGKNYNEMGNSFNCKTNLTDREISGWPCSTLLKDLQDENTFYIKCKDQPWKSNDEDNLRNVNTEDFEYNLYVSENELEIDSISISHNDLETDLNFDTSTEIRGGSALFSVELGVKTSGGVDNGISACSYEWNNELIPFLNSNSNIHKQKFNLVKGNYDVLIKCEDEAGNEASKNAKFNLNIDSSPPKAIRVYYESGNLNLITNEQAKCYASFDEVKQCNFNINNVDSMTSVFSTEHSINWYVDRIYYIKCKDLFDNQNPSCAIKISPSFI